MARIRVGGVARGSSVPLLDAEPFAVPSHLADLEEVPGACFSRAVVVQCGSPGEGIECTLCMMAALGEKWDLFKARTNSGIPKGKFYRDLDREQGEPDPAFRRAWKWWESRGNSPVIPPN